VVVGYAGAREDVAIMGFEEPKNNELAHGLDSESFFKRHPLLVGTVAGGALSFAVLEGGKLVDQDSANIEQLLTEKDVAAEDVVRVLEGGFRGDREALLARMAPHLKDLCYKSDKEWSFTLRNSDGIYELVDAQGGGDDHVSPEVSGDEGADGAHVVHMHNHPVSASVTLATNPRFERLRQNYGFGEYSGDMEAKMLKAYRSGAVPVPYFPPNIADVLALGDLSQLAQTEEGKMQGIVAGCNGVWGYERAVESRPDDGEVPIDDDTQSFSSLHNFQDTGFLLAAPYSADAWKQYFETGDDSDIQAEFEERTHRVLQLVQYAEELGYTFTYTPYTELRK